MNLDVVFSHPLSVYYAAAILIIVPMIRIFERAGFRPWWVLLLGAPGAGYLLCAGVLTFSRWPLLPAQKKLKE